MALTVTAPAASSAGRASRGCARPGSPAPLPIAAPNSVLAMWVNGASIKESLSVVLAWGFDDPNDGLIWHKASRAARPRMGLGRTTRKDSESLWLAKQYPA